MNARAIIQLALATVVLLSGSLVSPLRAEVRPDRPLAVGDRLRYRVTEDGEPTVELVVGNTGAVELPFYGPLDAAGLTIPELRASIKTALETELYVTATVNLTVAEYRMDDLSRGRVHLSGQVRQVGPVEIDLSRENFLGRVLLAAGGLTDFADKRNVRIVRQHEGGETRTITVDLRAVLDQGRLEQDVALQDGDFVIVGEKLINW
ncbi:polysaccharide biosynthesis/export family protein [Actomonas aquatica]|uniref:Polysaccharide biosynthesis/export family protein n=1 Tax=Actomonas aquatica TaxID=2866162 RepID=A0ABZ1CAC9_9BACT|nr:polysaccharide biosynthesis/export family protein [Opitutus sp. WL0086]WRQ88426.1 polysaccharide biosynthesis/export family protein [Opitutus sp. WL0086]